MLRVLLGVAFEPPEFCLRKLQEKLDRAGRLVAPSATVLVLLRFCFGWCQIIHHARMMPSAESSTSPPLKGVAVSTSLQKKKGCVGTKDPVLQSLAAFLAQRSSTTSLCSTSWSEYNDTDVIAAEPQVRRNTREDAAWRPDGATRTQSYLSNFVRRSLSRHL